MDVLSERIIDIGLNVIGYLAAAGLGMLLHSAVVQRHRRAATTDEPNREIADPSETKARQVVPSAQFLDLRRRPDETARPQRGAGGPGSTARADGRRDRIEIIRLARQMLNAGTPGETVQRTLPISEGQLALLQSVNSR